MKSKVIAHGVFFPLLVMLLSQSAYAAQQVSQFGITWTFDRNYQVGRFANGDYWVVGPVTIIKIDPSSTKIDGRVINGSMVNPSPTNKHYGYDSTMAYHKWDPKLNVARPNDQDLSSGNPLILKPDSSLVSTISIKKPKNKPQIKIAAILTVLAEPAPQGSFRPPYSGTDKTIKFNKNRLNYSLLKKLKPVPGVPSLAKVERYFQRPWIDHKRGWSAQYLHPKENMPNYGREISMQVGTGSLMLHLNFSDQQKEKLLIRYVQLGIDLYGIVQSGGAWNWSNDGGHASGRKWPILFAGLLLGDPEMKNIGRVDIQNYNSAHPQYIHFGEDDQTFYVSDKDILKPPYKKYTKRGFTYYGHGGSISKKDHLEYTQCHHGMPEWGIRHATKPLADGLDWTLSYRRCCTANAWAGFVLAAHIMGAKELWNHDALFDYMDRYMQIELAQGHKRHWMRQWSRFTGDMWDFYRPHYGPVWTMAPTLHVAVLGGSVTKTPDKAAHALGQEVILRAVADDGYEFAGWSGGITGTNNPAKIVMHANQTVTANFAANENLTEHESK